MSLKGTILNDKMADSGILSPEKYTPFVFCGEKNEKKHQWSLYI